MALRWAAREIARQRLLGGAWINHRRQSRRWSNSYTMPSTERVSTSYLPFGFSASRALRRRPERDGLLALAQPSDPMWSIAIFRLRLAEPDRWRQATKP